MPNKICSIITCYINIHENIEASYNGHSSGGVIGGSNQGSIYVDSCYVVATNILDISGHNYSSPGGICGGMIGMRHDNGIFAPFIGVMDTIDISNCTVKVLEDIACNGIASAAGGLVGGFWLCGTLNALNNNVKVFGNITSSELTIAPDGSEDPNMGGGCGGFVGGYVSSTSDFTTQKPTLNIESSILTVIGYIDNLSGMIVGGHQQETVLNVSTCTITVNGNNIQPRLIGDDPRPDVFLSNANLSLTQNTIILADNDTSYEFAYQSKGTTSSNNIIILNNCDELVSTSLIKNTGVRISLSVSTKFTLNGILQGGANSLIVGSDISDQVVCVYYNPNVVISITSSELVSAPSGPVSLTGTIEDNNGAPLANTFVQYYNGRYKLSQNAQTDSNGNIVLDVSSNIENVATYYAVCNGQISNAEVIYYTNNVQALQNPQLYVNAINAITSGDTSTLQSAVNNVGASMSFPRVNITNIADSAVPGLTDTPQNLFVPLLSTNGTGASTANLSGSAPGDIIYISASSQTVTVVDPNASGASVDIVFNSGGSASVNGATLTPNSAIVGGNQLLQTAFTGSVGLIKLGPLEELAHVDVSLSSPTYSPGHTAALTVNLTDASGRYIVGARIDVHYNDTTGIYGFTNMQGSLTLRFIAATSTLPYSISIGGISFSLDGTPTIPVSNAGAVCFLATAPVLTPSGYVKISALTVGDEIVTGDGRTVKIQRIRCDETLAGPLTNPYIIQKGQFGAIKRLLISPNHRVQTSKGLIEACSLGLKQEEMSGSFDYYNIELPNWERDTMVVAGVTVESLAPIRRITVTREQFVALVKSKYGKISNDIMATLKRTCRFLENGRVDVPVMYK